MPIPADIIQQAQNLNNQGQTGEAWSLLGTYGDAYAVNAAFIIQEFANPTDVRARLVKSHWTRLVGEQVMNDNFAQVGQRHLNNYLNELQEPDNVLPDSEFIEEQTQRTHYRAHVHAPSPTSPLDLPSTSRHALQNQGELSWTMAPSIH